MLNRSITAYQACDPQAVASGSKAQMANFIEDAKSDIAMLGRALQLCQRTLADLIKPDVIRDTSALHAFAQVVEAESVARHALAASPEYEGKKP
jgi:hypothetical protein